MKGAIIGDIIGSAFVNDNKTSTDFQLFKPFSSFTHDTILTLATADAIFNKLSFEECLKSWVKRYPYAGYRSNFKEWIDSEKAQPYISSGDGAARRISPIGLAAETLEKAIEKAKESTVLTHNQPEKIKASEAVTACIFLAKTKKNKSHIKKFVEDRFDYKLDYNLNQLHDMVIKPDLPSPAPLAINIFLLSDNYEDAIRKAISIGGPSNTIASITGGIAHAYFKHIPRSIIRRALNRLTPEMERMIENFESKHLEMPNEQKEILISLH